ncbi:hypothetical protein ACN20G_35940 (plasmid) [Streptomyces sp. BI20]|uniref:hypothetical protein n=1 Tax=Streptomyces sp. BI20 TaxID=3403460 RepID=UPI003C707D12
MIQCTVASRILAPDVLRAVPREAEHDPGVRCELGAPHAGRHASFVCYLDPGARPLALWARWADEAGKAQPERHMDCPIRAEDGDVCVLFSGHTGPHGWQVDPGADTGGGVDTGAGAVGTAPGAAPGPGAGVARAVR